MKIISHRGNLDGPDPLNENSPVQVEKCFQLGFECEIDLRLRENRLFLGHDIAQYPISLDWIVKHSEILWIHCKDSESLIFLKQTGMNLNYFWHETDKHTITSQGNFWNYPGGPIDNESIAVLPESWWNSQVHLPLTQGLGICTDFPSKFRQEWNLV